MLDLDLIKIPIGQADQCNTLVWPAAHRLAEYVNQSCRDIGLTEDCCRVLELGSGTGWLGVTLAQQLPIQVVVTDCESAMPNLKMNVDQMLRSCKELQTDAPGKGSVSCATFDWFDATIPVDERPSRSPLGEDWHCILGSDLIYNPDGAELLPHVFSELLSKCPNAMLLYAHTLYRFGSTGPDLEFYSKLCSEGLCCRTVWLEPPKVGKKGLGGLGGGPHPRVGIFQVYKESASPCREAPVLDCCYGRAGSKEVHPLDESATSRLDESAPARLFRAAVDWAAAEEAHFRSNEPEEADAMDAAARFFELLNGTTEV
eukprot:gnl/MRDRNA2_/MRDRNA2_82402_c0_seq1.p1 gnl/MRDRNA2_/MRDRNA2_82402_c0~~gnl/MRDRNA2_/MRDRNA2_82402_c0_seq1.p1  ORF type:complete len:334 (+),score=63.18 gnl/MRDRNA2_/MRDRNA2_82402_c0_seq1:58-1002(+)